MRHPSTAPTKHPAIVRRMAGTIERITEGFGACTEADLLRSGFTAAEVKAHGSAARDLAAETLRHHSVAA